MRTQSKLDVRCLAYSFAAGFVCIGGTMARPLAFDVSACVRISGSSNSPDPEKTSFERRVEHPSHRAEIPRIRGPSGTTFPTNFRSASSSLVKWKTVMSRACLRRSRRPLRCSSRDGFQGISKWKTSCADSVKFASSETQRRWRSRCGIGSPDR